MDKQILHTDKLARPVGVFSHAVKVPAAGRLVFVSGLVPRPPEGGTVGRGDVRAQTRYVLESLRAILAEAGGMVEVSRLVDLDHLIEIEAVAVVA